MTLNKRPKISRLRGTHTHGWGAKKKHRGSGSRGGKGNAGSGKRADSKAPSVWKSDRVFGRYGFHSHTAKASKAMNISDLEMMDIEAKDGVIVVDLQSLGFTKILGRGTATKKYKIIGEVSAKAQEKIVAAGGEVTQ